MSSDETELESLLSIKSKERYIHAYESFITWRNDKNTRSFSEEVLLGYFEEMASKYKPSTLWAMFSMLKHSLKCKHDVNMKNYQQLRVFLKKLSKGFVSKRVKAFSMENVERFLEEAPDDKYLSTKVALIFGVTAGYRQQDLADMTTKDIENHGEVFVLKAPRTKESWGSFVIEGKHYQIVKKYLSLRLPTAPTNRFFQHFRNGKCRNQVIGKNRFGAMSKQIAEFLNVPVGNAFIGHVLRHCKVAKSADYRRVAERCTDDFIIVLLPGLTLAPLIYNPEMDHETIKQH